MKRHGEDVLSDLGRGEGAGDLLLLIGIDQSFDGIEKNVLSVLLWDFEFKLKRNSCVVLDSKSLFLADPEIRWREEYFTMIGES